MALGGVDGGLRTAEQLLKQGIFRQWKHVRELQCRTGSVLFQRGKWRPCSSAHPSAERRHRDMHARKTARARAQAYTQRRHRHRHELTQPSRYRHTQTMTQHTDMDMIGCTDRPDEPRISRFKLHLAESCGAVGHIASRAATTPCIIGKPPTPPPDRGVSSSSRVLWVAVLHLPTHRRDPVGRRASP